MTAEGFNHAHQVTCCDFTCLVDIQAHSQRQGVPFTSICTSALASPLLWRRAGMLIQICLMTSRSAATLKLPRFMFTIQVLRFRPIKCCGNRLCTVSWPERNNDGDGMIQDSGALNREPRTCRSSMNTFIFLYSETGQFGLSIDPT